MRKDITICIGTVGYPTFERCYRQASIVAKKNKNIKDIVVIKDKYPTSSWLNEMRKNIETQWVLQIDEDMYIYENAVDELLNLAKIKTNKKNIKVLNASGLLYDLFLETNIGSLKLWNTDSFNLGRFKNVQGSDRQFAKDLSVHGFENVSISKVLGEHDSAPSEDIAYFKYKEYVQKLIRYQDKKSGKKFINFLTKKHKRQNDPISFFALQGGIAGYRFPEQNETKNYLKNKSSDELYAVRKKFKKIK